MEIKGKQYESKISKRVKKLANVDTFNLWNAFKNGMKKACREVCEKKKGKRNHGDTWWWNEEVNKPVIQKKESKKCA